MERNLMRKSGIAARDSLDKEIRKSYSGEIVASIINSPEFIEAKNIMIYNAIRGEVSLKNLEVLTAIGELKEKKLLYPLCKEDYNMIALHPFGEDSWKKGAYGILEPVETLSEEVKPEDIDLVICPCTVFDEECNRMGMGAGYYDRFLTKCTKAKIVAVAFEAQKTERVITDFWDKPMEKVYTELKIYTRKEL